MPGQTALAIRLRHAAVDQLRDVFADLLAELDVYKRQVLWDRSNNCTPVACSSREMAWLTAGWVRCMACAACRVDPVMTTV